MLAPRRLALPASLVALCLAALLALRLAAPDGAPWSGPAVTAVLGLLLASGLWLARRAARLDARLDAGPRPRESPEGPPGVRDAGGAEAAPDRAAGEAPRPVLRLIAANLEGLRAAGVPASGRPVRLALRLYAAGACDLHAGTAAAAALEDCLLRLGEPPEDAARFAASLDGLLVSPAHLALYRAGRDDLAARPAGDGPGPAFRPALARWAAAWEGAREDAREDGAVAVAVVAPVAARHAAAVEAVVRAFGGEPCGRPGARLVAAFADPAAALGAARALSEAVLAAPGGDGPAPGIGLAPARLPRPDREDAGGAVAAAEALAAAAGPGGVALSRALRAALGTAMDSALDSDPARRDRLPA